MANCSYCKEPGHTAPKHSVPCVICGFTTQVDDISPEALRIAKETFNCGNDAEHQKIRNAWDMTYEQVRRLKKK